MLSLRTCLVDAGRVLLCMVKKMFLPMGEVLLMHNSIQTYDFSEMRDKRVLVKGCSDELIPNNAYVELVEQLKPLVKSLMFGEACSNVPIFKN